MSTPLSISVESNATIYRRAERAVVKIRVHSEGSSQDNVSKMVTKRSNELRTMLKEMALKDIGGNPAPEAAITHWSMNTLTTSSQVLRDNKGKALPREYRASTNFEVRFRDFRELGSFASMVLTMENTSVQNISWELTDATKASLATECRTEAIRNAMHQARDYAEALGRAEVTAVEVIGGQSGLGQNQYYGSNPHELRIGGAVGAGIEGLNFEPENVSFSCRVTVKCKAV